MNEALKILRHELETLHGLYVFDFEAPAETWPLDMRKALEALTELEGSTEKAK